MTISLISEGKARERVQYPFMGTRIDPVLIHVIKALDLNQQHEAASTTFTFSDKCRVPLTITVLLRSSPARHHIISWVNLKANSPQSNSQIFKRILIVRIFRLLPHLPYSSFYHF